MNAETAEKDKNQTEQAQEETKAPEASAENQANKPETESSKTADKNTAAEPRSFAFFDKICFL